MESIKVISSQVSPIRLLNFEYIGVQKWWPSREQRTVQIQLTHASGEQIFISKNMTEQEHCRVDPWLVLFHYCNGGSFNDHPIDATAQIYKDLYNKQIVQGLSLRQPSDLLHLRGYFHEACESPRLFPNTTCSVCTWQKLLHAVTYS